MADCLAGVWAKGAQQTTDAQGNAIIADLTQDDIRRAIDAAQAVGDDRIQKRTSGRVDTDSFTHGSAEQRVQLVQPGPEARHHPGLRHLRHRRSLSRDPGPRLVTVQYSPASRRRPRRGQQ